MKKTTTEICRDRFMELGTAMFALLTGRELHSDQIDMIKEASDKEKVLSMEMVAASNLKGQNYTNYCQNRKKIKKK